MTDRLDIPTLRTVRRALRAMGAPPQGRCGACHERLHDRDAVRLHGEDYHRDCAFYRSRRKLAA